MNRTLMRLRITAVIASFILALHAFGFQKNLSLKHVSSDLGLPGKTVRAILQDHRGFVWIGLENGGVSRYNGSEFVVYQFDPADPNSLSSNYVNTLFLDRRNQLWIGTENGLNRYDSNTKRFQRIGRSDGLNGSIILDIHQDNQGLLWVATENGLNRLDPDTLVFAPAPVIQTEHADEQKIVCNDIFQDSQQRIWIATRSGIFRYQPDSNTCVRPSEIDLSSASIRAKEFYSIVEDANGVYWFAHQAGLTRYIPDQDLYQPINIGGESQDPEETNVGSLMLDHRGYLWVGTFSDGLRIIDVNTSEVLTYRNDPFNPQGLLSNSIRSIYEDHSGLVWIGAKFEGIFLYNREVETFPHFTGSLVDKQGLHGSHVLSILEDSAGDVWIGTKRGGLNALDPATGSYQTFEASTGNPNGLADNRIEALVEGEDNRLWLGTERGISSFDRNTQTFENHNTFIVRSLLPKSATELYVGTNYGIQIFDTAKKEFQDFPVVDGIDLSTNSTIEVKALSRDHEGNLLIGTHHSGLYRFSPSKNTLETFAPNQPPSHRISGYMIRSIFQDQKQNLWIGTRLKGLNRIDANSGQITTYTTADGLPSDTIFSIGQDSTGKLWLTTDAGLCSFDPQTLASISFTEAHGLQGNIFEPNAFCQTKEGFIYVGGDGGYNRFNPLEIEKRERTGNVVLSSVTVLGEPIPIDLGTAAPLALDYDKNYLSFAFALTDYSLPGQNEFSYKLEGLDDDWIYSGRRNYATYTSLNPGPYRLLVRARLPAGAWVGPATVFAFDINPPFWKTTPFIVSTILIFLTILGATYLILTKRQRWKQLELEKKVRRRTSELRSANKLLTEQSAELATHRDNLESMVQQRTYALEEEKRKAEESDRLKTSFLANMSHEIRTPMNAIIGFATILTETEISEEERRQYSLILGKNCSGLLKLIDDILDISSIESGQLTINKYPFDLGQLVLEVASSFTTQIQDKDPDKFQLRLAQSVETRERLIISDPDRLRQILNNLVSNAIKFTSQGHISLTYRFDQPNQLIHFQVEDTGIGIQPENLSVIWDRFRKIEDDSSRLYRGTGLGLSITKNLVELLGGTISVSSTPGKGSVFSFSIQWLDGANEKTVPSEQPNPSLVLPSSRHRKPLILVAEDEESNFWVIEKLLLKERCELLRAKNGKEAIAICQERHQDIDLVLMDIKMPEMDGKTATKLIKESHPSLPVLAYTAYATMPERAEIMKYSFDGYISKPVTPDSIRVALREHITLETS